MCFFVGLSNFAKSIFRVSAVPCLWHLLFWIKIAISWIILKPNFESCRYQVMNISCKLDRRNPFYSLSGSLHPAVVNVYGWIVEKEFDRMLGVTYDYGVERIAVLLFILGYIKISTSNNVPSNRTFTTCEINTEKAVKHYFLVKLISSLPLHIPIVSFRWC